MQKGMPLGTGPGAATLSVSKYDTTTTVFLLNHVYELWPECHRAWRPSSLSTARSVASIGTFGVGLSLVVRACLFFPQAVLLTGPTLGPTRTWSDGLQAAARHIRPGLRRGSRVSLSYRQP